MFNHAQHMYIPDKIKVIKTMVMVSISILILSGFVFGIDTIIANIYQMLI